VSLLHREDGQVLIEFALVSSLFIFLFVGIVDYAIYIHMQIELNEAAAAAAAFGAAPDNQTNTTTMTEVATLTVSDIGNMSVNSSIIYRWAVHQSPRPPFAAARMTTAHSSTCRSPPPPPSPPRSNGPGSRT
jgi:Flp pilus assembly protein TadG